MSESRLIPVTAKQAETLHKLKLRLLAPGVEDTERALLCADLIHHWELAGRLPDPRVTLQLVQAEQSRLTDALLAAHRKIERREEAA